MRHLRELLEMIDVRVIAAPVTVANAGEAFGPAGDLLRGEDREALRRAAEELAGAVREDEAAA
jgi:hypothetical protein